MSTLIKKIDAAASAEWKPSPMMRFILVSACIVLMLGIAYGGWEHARFKTELDAQKWESIKLADKTTNFGQVIFNRDGQIISWNKGMTELLGWTSKEMRGQTIERLDPKGHDTKAFNAIGDPQDWPWKAEGVLEVATKDGGTRLVNVTIRDITGKDQSFRRVTLDAYDPQHPETPEGGS